MKRTQKEKTLKWKKVGGSDFYAVIGGKRVTVKKNQEFKATEDEIPKAFRDQVVCLSKVVDKQPVKNMTGADYKIAEVEGDEEFFNVVNAKGENQNDEPLEKEEAEELATKLNTPV